MSFSLYVYRSILGKVLKKLKHGIFIDTILNKLTDIGIEIEPYFVVEEKLIKSLDAEFGRKYKEYKVGFLREKDMCLISEKRTYHSVEYYLKQLRKGKKCFGVMLDNELVAFMWVDFTEFSFRAERSLLKKGEAYLYDAFTFEEYRGKGIAAFMRYHCYKALVSMEIKKFYSITNFFNTPAKKFKMRLGAEIIKIGLFVELFKKYSCTFILKKMNRSST